MPDLDHLQTLRSRVMSGEYRVDSERVAVAMIEWLSVSSLERGLKAAGALSPVDRDLTPAPSAPREA